MPNEAKFDELTRIESAKPKSDIYVAVCDLLKEEEFSSDQEERVEIRPEDVEMALGGFIEGVEWIAKEVGLDFIPFDLDIWALDHDGPFVQFTKETTTVIMPPILFKNAANARMLSFEGQCAVDEIQVDARVFPGLPEFSLPVRELFRSSGVAEGVHLIQRMIGQGTLTADGFTPMLDPDIKGSILDALESSFSPSRMRQYTQSKFEIEEKTWVHKYFQEKFGDNNPYSDFYHAFVKAGEALSQTYQITIGGETPQQLKDHLRQAGVNVNEEAGQMIESKNFTTLETAKDIEIVYLSIEDLGLDRGATIDEIYRKAQEREFELCPAEIGLRLCLAKNSGQLKDDCIAMEPIHDQHGRPFIFQIGKAREGVFDLAVNWAPSDRKWHRDERFVFCRNKSL